MAGRSTIDVFDIFAFVVIGVLLTTVVVIVVTLGQLPGQIAKKRNHPQAAAIIIAGWLGVATFGLLWPFSLIWAFLKPFPASSSGTPTEVIPHSVPTQDSQGQLEKMQTQVDALEATIKKLQTK
ncbi:DUF3302 domain-containing protein [Polystyrenella longa]|uniref:DUF3302 domain-containing protein n=1 Tax=Polystyrenella longa TaxID=2528007 RepID=UPI0011AAC93C|nr:DUF3302 domain-containing protein [Polystyrenella longa]